MKIHLVSDLHLEWGAYPFKAPKGTDVIIAAGDISPGGTGPMFLRKIFGAKLPIVYIAGNHEFYHQEYWENHLRIRDYAEMHDVYYLDNDKAEIDGVTFIGGTMWSDYCLHGIAEQFPAMVEAGRSMNDFRRIVIKKDGKEHVLEPVDTLGFHLTAMERFQSLMASVETPKTVMVTHMAPHPGSVHKKYSGDPVNPYYASDLTKFITQNKPNLWVHGHMHDSFDYTVEDTRIVCNPRGYVFNPRDTKKAENAAFNPNLLIDI